MQFINTTSLYLLTIMKINLQISVLELVRMSLVLNIDTDTKIFERNVANAAISFIASL